MQRSLLLSRFSLFWLSSKHLFFACRFLFSRSLEALILSSKRGTAKSEENLKKFSFSFLCSFSQMFRSPNLNSDNAGLGVIGPLSALRSTSASGLFSASGMSPENNHQLIFIKQKVIFCVFYKTLKTRLVPRTFFRGVPSKEETSESIKTDSTFSM